MKKLLLVGLVIALAGCVRVPRIPVPRVPPPVPRVPPPVPRVTAVPRATPLPRVPPPVHEAAYPPGAPFPAGYRQPLHGYNEPFPGMRDPVTKTKPAARESGANGGMHLGHIHVPHGSTERKDRDEGNPLTRFPGVQPVGK
jgi:hypothetical protein